MRYLHSLQSSIGSKGPLQDGMIAKLGIVEEEADEMIFWLGMSRDKGFLDDKLCTELTIEASEILSIIVASIKTARANIRAEKKSRAVRL